MCAFLTLKSINSRCARYYYGDTCWSEARIKLAIGGGTIVPCFSTSKHFYNAPQANHGAGRFYVCTYVLVQVVFWKNGRPKVAIQFRLGCFPCDKLRQVVTDLITERTSRCWQYVCYVVLMNSFVFMHLIIINKKLKQILRSMYWYTLSIPF